MSNFHVEIGKFWKMHFCLRIFRSLINCVGSTINGLTSTACVGWVVDLACPFLLTHTYMPKFIPNYHPVITC